MSIIVFIIYTIIVVTISVILGFVSGILFLAYREGWNNDIIKHIQYNKKEYNWRYDG